jgi:hypothetical protein
LGDFEADLFDTFIHGTYIVVRKRRILANPIFDHTVEDTLEYILARSLAIRNLATVVSQLCAEQAYIT